MMKNSRAQMFQQSKKAQVTIFLIIGILLVFSSGMVFYLRNSVSEDRLAREIISSASKVPLDTLPVKEFTDECLRTVSINALNYIGMHGGYYNLSEFRVDPMLVNSEVVKDDYQTVPYWYFMDNCPERTYGCGQSLQPGIKAEDKERSIQVELENYVDSHIKNCLNDYSVFEGRYDVTMTAEPRTSVVIRKKDVYFKLNLPLNIQNNKGDYVKADTFVQSVKVGLEDIYNFAKDLVESESNSGFLEQLVFDSMSLYMGFEDELPPIDQMDTESPKFWMTKDVLNLLNNDLLPMYIPMIQFQGVANPTLIAQDMYDNEMLNSISYGFFNSLTGKRVSEHDYGNLLVDVEYVPDNLYLSLNDGSYLIQPTDVMSSMNSANPILLIMNVFNVYKTRYDMSFPIVVTITDTSADKSAFNDQGYSFRFAMELNIRNNAPYIDSVQLLGFNSTKRKYDLSDYPTMLPNKTFVVNVVDAYTDASIQNANVEYICGRKYHLGETDDFGVLVAKLPQCAQGGRIKVVKEGYSSKYYQFSNNANKQGGTLTVPIWQIKDVNVLVKKALVDEYVVGTTPIDELMSALSANLNVLFEDPDSRSALELLTQIPGVDFVSKLLEMTGATPSSTDVLEDRLEELQMSNMLFLLLKDGGTFIASFFVPWGTLASVIINGVYELTTMALRELGDYEFPITNEEYINMTLNQGYYDSEYVLSELEANDSVMIVFTPLFEQTSPVPMVGYIVMNSTSVTEKLDLIPGEYEVSIMLNYNGNFTMNVDSICSDSFLFEEICNAILGLDLDPINLSAYITGGWEDTIEVKPEDLYESDSLNFIVVDQGLPESTMDIKDEGFVERAKELIGDYVLWS